MAALTSFDFAVLAILILSMLFAAWRGLAREVLGFAGWVAAFAAAVFYSANVAALLPSGWGGPGLRYLIASAVVFIGTLLVFGLLGWMFSRTLRAIGLGFVDRILGAVFGLARGLLIVLALVLVAGVTGLPAQPWWRRAVLAPPLEVAVLALRPWLPLEIARQLHYPGSERAPARLARGRN